MNYSIPSSLQEIAALRQSPTTTETVARAMAGVVRVARQQGRTLDELVAEMLLEDAVLDDQQRSWLCEMIKNIWHRVPVAGE
ncbi:hypothetical protein [Prochlorothrix hollandica]|uniref:hypothetical protein n=1 Tax=Prochlorothrix hollandica TaxID=1223 RepID=UPI003342171F